MSDSRRNVLVTATPRHPKRGGMSVLSVTRGYPTPPEDVDFTRYSDAMARRDHAIIIAIRDAMKLATEHESATFPEWGIDLSFRRVR